MQSRRTFLKMGIVGSAFLPAFADLSAKATEKKGVSANAREINVAIVGFGAMGRVIAHGLARCEGIRVKCACDIWKFNMQQAQALFKAYGHKINGYLDFQEMIDAEAKNIEAVIVATPDWVHCRQACECLRRGLHVYCTAPMADTLEKSAEMCRAAKASGKLLQIGHLRRSARVYKLAFEHVVPEMLGRLLFAEAESRMSIQPMWAMKKCPRLEILTKNGYDNAEQFLNWRWFGKYGPGNVLRYLVSQADLFCQAWGGPPHSVTAVGGRDIFRPPRENIDNLSSIFEFKLPDGATAHATHHFAVAHRRTRNEFEEFNGARAILHLSPSSGIPKMDGPVNYVRRTWNGSQIEYKEKWRTFVEKGWILPSDSDRKYNEIDEIDCHPTDMPDADISSLCPLNVKHDEKSYAMLHLENFFAAVRGEAQLNAPADKIYASMVAAFGALRSAARRETVYFKPSDFTF